VALTPEERSERIAITREAAAALVGDLLHIRKVIATQVEPDPDELRRLSGTLRRILVQRDLTAVSAPRMGRISLVAPDNKPFFKSSEKNPFVVFCSGGAMACGVYMRALSCQKGHAEPVDYKPERDAVELSIDGFLNQPVLCLHGSWARRVDVIEYTANVASGVHSGTPKKNEAHHLLSHIRNVVALTIVPMGDTKAASININMDSLSDADGAFVYRPNAIDPVLFELLAAGHFLANSPDVAKLEQIVKEELA
jgi:hypothetical protein